MRSVGRAAEASPWAALQPSPLPRGLCEAIEGFDRSTLRPAGTVYLASRAVTWLMPDAHGFVFVGEPGGHTRLYSHGLQAGTYALRKSKVKEFIADAAAEGMPFPAALLAALRARVGKAFISLEALLEDLRTSTGTAEPMPMPWHDFGLLFLARLCRASRVDFVLAAKTAGLRVTWRGLALQPPQLQRLRGALPEPLCAALAPQCGQPFADAEALLQSVCPQPEDAAQQATWRAWAAAVHQEAQHLLGSARSGHPIDQADEAHLRTHPSLRCRAYPALRHEFVRDAWRQLFWGREYLRESVVGLMAFTAEEAEVQRQRLAPEWMRYAPGSDAHSLPPAWFVGHAERLPFYRGRQNCNTAAAALLREGHALQRLHAQRQGLPEPPPLSLRGASWRNVGTTHPMPVWRPVRCDTPERAARADEEATA